MPAEVASTSMPIMVAPDGGRRTKLDQPGLPLSPDDLARTAAQCRDAGASMIHVPVGEGDGSHPAEAGRAATAALGAAAGPATCGPTTCGPKSCGPCSPRPEARVPFGRLRRRSAGGPGMRSDALRTRFGRAAAPRSRARAVRALDGPPGTGQFGKTFSQPVEPARPGGSDVDEAADRTLPARNGRAARVTIHDVARASEVSIATASKALSGQGRMAVATRERVKEVAKALSFRPNAIARALLKQRSFTIGLLTDDTYGRFTLPVMAGISEALVDRGVSVFLCSVERDSAVGQSHVDAMLEKQVDGIIASGKRLDRRLSVDLSVVDVPVVYAYCEGPEGSIGFVSDDRAGACLAVERLMALGRRRIAHVTGPADFAVVPQRARGFAEALARAGLRPFTEHPMVGEWSEAWGFAAAERLLADPAGRPDAVFCGNDQIARGLIDALALRGVAVPGDIAVVGFDNWEIFAAATRPPLTTVDMNLKDLGRHAGLTLLDLVEGRPVPPGVRALPCRLVVRRSCG